jgi:Na+-translocating ferredoxin:NAD+ oxidoreductase subunit C
MTVESPAESSPLRRIDPPARLLVPLSTRPTGEAPFGLPAGTVVSKGQALAEAVANAGPAALAPTSGRVIGPARVTMTNGQNVPALEIECDFEDRAGREEHDYAAADHARQSLDDLDKLTPDDLGRWIDRLRGAGVWADRTTSPDLIAQLHQALRRPIDTIICNLVDHDAHLRLQATLAGRFGHLIVSALSLLARLTGVHNVWVATEAGGPNRWWQPLRRELRAGGIDIVPVLADYPQADPTLLIYTLLRRRLRPGRLPTEQGVLLLDGVAAVAVGRAAVRDQPMLQTPLAVRDHLRDRSHVLVAPIGTPVRHVLGQLELPNESVTLLRGDVLRDQPTTCDAVLAGGEAVLHVLHAMPPVNPDPCIRCAWCAQACPTQVQPAGVLESSQRMDLDLAERSGIEACIECGICSYVCPSHLPLLAGIRAVKKEFFKPTARLGG